TVLERVQEERDRPGAQRDIRGDRVNRMPKPGSVEKVLDGSPGRTERVVKTSDGSLRHVGSGLEPLLFGDPFPDGSQMRVHSLLDERFFGTKRAGRARTMRRCEPRVNGSCEKLPQTRSTVRPQEEKNRRKSLGSQERAMNSASASKTFLLWRSRYR